MIGWPHSGKFGTGMLPLERTMAAEPPRAVADLTAMSLTEGRIGRL